MLFDIQPVTSKTIELLHQLIYQLAKYEKLSQECTLSVSTLSKALLCESPTVFCLIATGPDGEGLGFALYSYQFSTFKGKSVLWLEDLFITSSSRGLGVGKALMQALENIAKENDCCRMEFRVLAWNKDAIAFYNHLNAEPLEDWIPYRLEL